MAVWRSVRKDLRRTPITEGHIAGANPLYVERYLLDGVDRFVRGNDMLGLIVFVGGSRVEEGGLEGGPERWRTSSLPTQMLLVPRKCPTRWHMSGVTDFGAFYFTDPEQSLSERLTLLAQTAANPIQFSDPLVAATTLQIFNELQKGSSCDVGFTAKLADVMLEQVYRVLTTPETGVFSPRHIHFPRLQKVLPYIREQLTSDLSVSALAARASLSATHFRRVFQEALGVPVHRYVLAARLEQARKLLGTTGMPISKIAHEAGFSSQSHLTSCFRAAHAATPAEYRRQIIRGGESGGLRGPRKAGRSRSTR